MQIASELTPFIGGFMLLLIFASVCATAEIVEPKDDSNKPDEPASKKRVLRKGIFALT